MKSLQCGRFLLAGAELRYTGIPFGCFRFHEAQKTTDIARQTASTLDVAETLLAAADLPPSSKRGLQAELQAYRQEYPQVLWKQTGRLARLGLPPSIVSPIRSLKQSLKKTVARQFKAS